MTTTLADLAEAPKMFEAENDPSLQRQSELNTLTNLRLAAAVDLQMQLKQAHWNVKGPNSISLRKLFDKIAERIVQVGGIAEETVCLWDTRSPLKEYLLTLADGRDARCTINAAMQLDDTDSAVLHTKIAAA